jgi:phage head maturation protease
VTAHLRSFVLDEPLHIRADGRTVEGLMVPWNTPASVTERDETGKLVTYDEAFMSTSFDRMQAAARKRGNWGWIALNLDHDESLDARVGFATEVDVRSDGAYGTFTLYRGPQLDKVRSMIEESHRGMSIEFVDVAAPRVNGGLTVRTQVHVRHVAVTPVPVYAGAGVLAVRHEDELPLSTPALDEVRAFLDGLK